jgi:hypothetical protein
MTRNMLFSYGYATKENNAADSLAISMVMRISWYSAERITQYDRSRATLDATGHHNRASIRPISSEQKP